MRLLTALLVLCAPLATTACGPTSEPPAGPDRPVDPETSEPAPTTDAPPPAGPFEGTTAETTRDTDQTSSERLVDVRTAAHDGFDRVTFEFDGDTLPGFTIAYVEEVTECGSGHAVPLAGEAALYVSFAPAAAHATDNAGERVPSITETDRQPGLEAVRQLTMTCDHHAGVGWGVGTASEAPYRVETLAAPARLALDVQHP